jgi:hypothetical protein
VLERALRAYIARPFAPRRITVEQWNGLPIAGTEGQALLQAIGFQNTPGGMEWWKG